MLDANQRAVLVIDRLRNPKLVETLEESRTGYRTVISTDLESGLWELDQQERSAALILLLLGEPGRQCEELLDDIRGNPRSRWVPTVVLAAQDDAGSLSSCDRAGVNSYVRFDQAKADEGKLVNSILRYWLQLNLLPDPRTMEVGGDHAR